MNSKETKQFILQALLEDTFKQDITTNMLVDRKKESSARIIIKNDGVVCGLTIAKNVFKKLDKNIIFEPHVKDGDKLKKGSKIVTIKGKTRALLTGERTALNFLGYMSGIATNTRKFVDKIKPYKSDILDTRKTTPGLRRLEKYAVKCGGGVNHRYNLREMVIIKDNHREISENFDKVIDSVKKIRKKYKKIVINVEVDTLMQLKQVLVANPDIVLLDNMSPARIAKAVAIVKNSKNNKKPLLEASGGINLKNVKSVAKTGVERISTGALTHTYRTIDMSMEIINS